MQQFSVIHRLGGGVRVTLLASAALVSACSGPIDIDLRNRGDGFNTALAAAEVPNRPRPDNRGVISYPNYQVVVARRNDTVNDIAARLGLDAATLARYNGIEPDVTLRRDEIIALPGRVAEPSPATGAAATGPIRPVSEVNVSELAGAAIDRVETSELPPAPTAAPAPAPTPVATPTPQVGEEPVRHQVQRGETAYSLSRLYGVPVRAIADWNGLGPDLGVREGQFLLIPRADAPAPTNAAPVTAPGAGSATPTPPSAAAPLPEESPEPVVPTPAEEAEENTSAAATPVETPNLGSEQTEAREAEFVYPVAGNIIRAYARGRNEGIDIGAPAGANVRAAAAGTVAAITTNTDGVQIVVIRHADNLLTVYTHVDDLTVERGARVSQGQTIGEVRAGDPSFVHFEVRNGMESRDPTNYLP